MSLFPHGYGRGWSEPLAEGKVARFFQIMREPATKSDWGIGLAIIFAVFTLFSVGLSLVILVTK